MRGVLGRVSAGAARKILDSTKIRVSQKAVLLTATTREHTESLTREHKFLNGQWKPREHVCQRI